VKMRCRHRFPAHGLLFVLQAQFSAHRDECACPYVTSNVLIVDSRGVAWGVLYIGLKSAE